MKDFTCCGLTLDSLHDLLQHFEETHTQASAQALPRTSTSGQGGLHPNNRGGNGNGNGFQSQPDSGTQTQFGFRPNQNNNQMQGFRSQRLGSDGFNRTNLSTVQDMDSLEDMEMDDASGLPPIEEQQPFQSQQQQFGQNNRIPNLNVNVANNMGRSSTPSTPSGVHQGFGLQHNPTVSSVNTPTLGTHSLGQQNKSSPDSSVPGTPAELDADFAGGYLGGLQMPLGSQMMQGSDPTWGNIGFGTGISGYDGTIDQPAKRLFSKQGGLTQQQLQMAFRNSQMSEDSELAKRLREQQIMAGANMPPVIYQEENKPFKCPVIGCEKAYKNQNGLKYHKQVCRTLPRSHRKRMLTFSIARSPESATQGERGRHFLDRRSRDVNPVSGHGRDGKGKAVPLRGVWQALQEPERAEIPPLARATMQS